MTEKTYSTDELAQALIEWDSIMDEEHPVVYEKYHGCRDAILIRLQQADELERKYNELVEVVSARTDGAKLRAADALCEALSGVCKALDDGGFIDCDILRKAIKDYEEAK